MKRETKMAGSNKGQDVPIEPNAVENPDDPRGWFGLFLREWVEKQSVRQNKGRVAVIDELAKTLKMKRRGIQKWLQGIGGPSFGDQEKVAKALGFSDYAKLSAAVVKFR